MLKKKNNLTIVIVTYLTNKDILLNCLESIDKNFKVLIVENSKKFLNKNFFLKKFPNLEIICSGKNLGYGKGNNFGISKVKTDYALILNPDTILENNFFTNVKNIIKKKNFFIIGCQYKNDKIFMPAGYFEVKKNKKFRKNFFIKKIKKLTKVDWVVGCAMLLNLNKFNKRSIFDENFFLYFEEFDLCKSIKNNNGSIYLSSELKVHHLGFKSSFSTNAKLKIEANKLKDWHWMWSYFYFYKKNYNYFYALYKVIGKLVKSFFKSIFYLIILDKENRNKYLYRFLGLFFSIIGKKSNYRVGRFY
jgi:N-acetylglucosaminyl-diphospho-decaprenol L-rhamnosyltransferase